ncbi:MAG: MFS transporter [Acidobacteriota bacterium]|nr:MFS transporter [Acidobacteriota bacterium]
MTACCGVFVSFASILIYTFGVFLKPLAATFGWSRAQVSLAFTVTALTVAACSPLIGRLLDRYPARRIVIPCTAVYGLAFGSLAFLTPHISHLLVVFLILGIVGNGTTQLGYARVISAWFDQSRGRALAAVMAGSGAGSMIFPPLAQALITSYGWRIAYAALGGLILVLGLPLAVLFLYEPEGSGKNQHPPDEAAPGESILRSVASYRFLGIVGALLLFSFATNGLNTHWAAMLTDRGFPAGQAATVLSVAGLAALVSKLSTGYLLDRFFAGRAAAVLMAICASGFLLVIYGHTPLAAFAGAALVGIGMGAESDAVPYLLTRYFGLQRFSELYGYTWFVYAIAGALGPLVMGRMFDQTGSYRLTLLACFGLVVIASMLFASLPKYRRARA